MDLSNTFSQRCLFPLLLSLNLLVLLSDIFPNAFHVLKSQNPFLASVQICEAKHTQRQKHGHGRNHRHKDTETQRHRHSNSFCFTTHICNKPRAGTNTYSSSTYSSRSPDSMLENYSLATCVKFWVSCCSPWIYSIRWCPIPCSGPTLLSLSGRINVDVKHAFTRVFQVCSIGGT